MNHVGEILKAEPGLKRVSRTKLYKGYLVTFVKAINDDGTLETEQVFKPVSQYDRAYLSTNKYRPHQGKQECVRRRVGGWAYHRSLGDFYMADGGPHTKARSLPHYLNEGKCSA